MKLVMAPSELNWVAPWRRNSSQMVPAEKRFDTARAASDTSAGITLHSQALPWNSGRHR